jgi:hypothetical protein
MIIETRQAAKDKAFDILDEIKDLDRKKKMAICELEETLYECFESSDEDEYEDEEFESEHESDEEDDRDMDFRNRKSYRAGRLHQMRKEDEEDDKYSSYKRRQMRMRRRNRMGRFV